MSNRQIQYWNDPDVAADLRNGTPGVSDLALAVEAGLSRNSRVVELGCGAGDDAAHFAREGHSVVALDVSHPLIDIAAQRFANLTNLSFRRTDISQPLDVGGESTDLVYSRLALHYFDDETTVGLFNEVLWILRSSGQFTFVVKSVDDPLYGKGTKIEDDMFDLDGHIRHFFSRGYVNELMAETGFTNVTIEEGNDKLYGHPAAYLSVTCSKR